MNLHFYMSTSSVPASGIFLEVEDGHLAQAASAGANAPHPPHASAPEEHSRFKPSPVSTEELSSVEIGELLREEVMSVELKVNGREALGLLGVGPESQIFVTCICFMDGGKCPASKQVVSEAEISAFRRKGRNHFASRLLVLSNNPPAALGLP